MGVRGAIRVNPPLRFGVIVAIVALAGVAYAYRGGAPPPPTVAVTTRATTAPGGIGVATFADGTSSLGRFEPAGRFVPCDAATTPLPSASVVAWTPGGRCAIADAVALAGAIALGTGGARPTVADVVFSNDRATALARFVRDAKADEALLIRHGGRWSLVGTDASIDLIGASHDVAGVSAQTLRALQSRLEAQALAPSVTP